VHLGIEVDVCGWPGASFSGQHREGLFLAEQAIRPEPRRGWAFAGSVELGSTWCQAAGGSCSVDQVGPAAGYLSRRMRRLLPSDFVKLLQDRGAKIVGPASNAADAFARLSLW